MNNIETSESQVLHITDNDFQAEVANSQQPVLLDFWAPWCGPCRMVGPILEQLANQFAGQVKIAKINVDENQRVAGELGVQAIPTLALYKNGQLENLIVGLRPKQELAKILEDVLK